MRPYAALALGIATGLFVFSGAAGFTGSLAVAVLVALPAAGLVGLAIARGRLVALDEDAAPRGLRVLSAAAAALALVLLCRLSVFMIDPSQVAASVSPSSQWLIKHSCLSSYFVAAQAARVSPNIYDNSLYDLPKADPTVPRNPRLLGPFLVDVYEYPPPFLLLPQALLYVVPDFLRLRMVWFALEGLVLLAVLLLVGHLLGPAAGTRALLLSPLVWASLPLLSTLQIGNVQPLVIVLAMLAMVLFERGRCAAGGALLAYAIVSKLFPGVLLVYLLARRQWRAAAWTGAFCGLLALATLATLGWAPYAAFLEHLPRLLGGEAFPALRRPAAIAINYSIPGLAFKLGQFGIPGMSFAASKILGWIYTPLLVAATLIAARRAWEERDRPLVWLALLLLATLRSPFLPQTYALIPPLWLLTLVVARMRWDKQALGLVLLGWLTFNLTLPIDSPLDPRIKSVLTTAVQLLVVGLALQPLRRRQLPARDASEPLGVEFAQAL